MGARSERQVMRHEKPAAIPPVAPQQQIIPRLLTIKQAAEYTSSSYWAIRDLLVADILPHIVIGKRHLIAREDLDSWIDKQLSASARSAQATAARIAGVRAKARA